MVKKKAKTGRKRLPEEEKVVLVGFYVKNEHIRRVGGMERAREIAKNTVENW
jgi:hypothetical protein